MVQCKDFLSVTQEPGVRFHAGGKHSITIDETKTIEAELAYVNWLLPVHISWTTKDELLREKTQVGPPTTSRQVWMCLYMKKSLYLCWNGCLYECMYVSCISLYICMCSLYSIYVCIQLYNAKGINDVVLNKHNEACFSWHTIVCYLQH